MLRFALVPSLALLVPSAPAQTVWFVDDDVGSTADFNDLQSAVDAASPGDRIEVFPGDYPDTVEISKGLTVMAETPGTAVLGLITIDSLPVDELLVITDVEVPFIAQIVARNCAGTIVVDGAVARISTRNCQDVRLQGTRSTDLSFRDSYVQVTDAAGPVSGIFVQRSTAILSNVVGQGRDGWVDSGAGFGCNPQHGQTALESLDSTVWLLDCSFTGGAGAIGSSLSCDAFPGPGIDARSSRLHIARTETRSGGLGLGLPGISPSISAFGTQILNENDLAAMQLRGGNQLGETAEFVTRAGAGTSARLWAGRAPIRVPFGDSIDVLHTSERGVSLGFMPPSEERTIPFTIPAIPRGTVIYVQARRTRTDRSDNSNSIALVVR